MTVLACKLHNISIFLSLYLSMLDGIPAVMVKLITIEIGHAHV